MDEPSERYTATDVMRATEPVVAPVSPSPMPATDRATTPLSTTQPPARLLDDPDAPGMERRTSVMDEPRPFSFGASFFGWNVAAFWTLVLTGIILGLLGASAYQTSVNNNGGLNLLDVANLTTGGFVGFLVATLLAYFLGGYVAGRMARGSGVANGAGVALWGVVAAIVLVILGTTLANTYNLGYYAQIHNVDWGALTGNAILGIVLTLAAMFLGAILGGLVGARPYVDRVESTTRTGTYRRGRPL